MQSYYKPVYLYYIIYLLGYTGQENFRLNGDREGGICEVTGLTPKNPPCADYSLNPDLLPSYPEYRRYTTDSLNKIIEQANICLNVTFPPLHTWRHENAQPYYQACRIIRNVAQTLIHRGLDQKRFQLLTPAIHDEEGKACARDLNNCDEYQKAKAEVEEVILAGNAELDRLWANN